jgi:hypothetical protein
VITKFDSNGCYLEKDGELVGKGISQNGIFKLMFSKHEDKATAALAATDKGFLWHQRLGHLGEASMKILTINLPLSGPRLPFLIMSPVCLTDVGSPTMQ